MYEERERKSLKRRIEKFVQLGKEKYGDQYDYSIAEKEYIKNRIPVHLICNKCKGEPFPVIPFTHTSKGDNEKGTCTHCYVPKQGVQQTRWDPNLHQRISEFRKNVEEKYGKGRYSYPNLEQEYKNEESDITVVCHGCDSKPYQRKARSLKSKSRKGGCRICNKKEMADTIAKKNRVRLLRNHQTQDIPREYGCIYMISNTKNNKFYIGYTTMGTKKRFKAHCDESAKLAKGNKKAKSYLHNAMNHHGQEHFKVKVLRSYTNITPLRLGSLEKKFIAKLQPHYNVSPGGELGHYKNKTKKDA